MTTLSQQVRAEYGRFKTALPELLGTHRAQWVVFLDGRVRTSHPTEDEALASAIGAFGPDAPFVIAQIEEISPVPLTAGVIFGIGA